MPEQRNTVLLICPQPLAKKTPALVRAGTDPVRACTRQVAAPTDPVRACKRPVTVCTGPVRVRTRRVTACTRRVRAGTRHVTARTGAVRARTRSVTASTEASSGTGIRRTSDAPSSVSTIPLSPFLCPIFPAGQWGPMVWNQELS